MVLVPKVLLLPIRSASSNSESVLVLGQAFPLDDRLCRPRVLDVPRLYLLRDGQR